MQGTVLVVDDDPAVADGHAARLRDHYAVRTAYGGREALDLLQGGDAEVDVVLLDRRMPDLDGETVLEELQSLEDPPQVAMVTGVDPGTDVAAMPFDDYLVKPVDRDRLFETVDGLFERASYDEHLQEYFAIASKLAVLETEHAPSTLDGNAEYRRLEARFEDLQRRLTDRLEDLGEESFDVALGARQS